MTTADVERMIAEVNGGAAKLTMVRNFLYNPGVIRAGRILESLNQHPRLVEFQILVPPDDNLTLQQHWCHNLPGGVFSEFLPHAIYLLRQFLGELELTSLDLLKLSAREWMKYDELQVSLGSREGQGKIRASLNSPHHRYIMDIYGETSAVRVDLYTRDVFPLRGNNMPFAAKIAEATKQASAAIANLRVATSYHVGRKHSPHEINMRLFVDSVLKGKAPPISLDEMQVLVKTQEQITELIDARST
jgi:predicted dehydrogenase